MPEGHTLHRLARDLNAALAGDVVAASSPQGRFAADAAAIDGDRFVRADAAGKHLFLALARGAVVHVHLGLQGRAFVRAPSATPLRSARLRLVGPRAAFDLVAPRTCARLDRDGAAAVVAGLGPDPLRDDVDADSARAALGATKRAIGAALLDQSLVAGVGNVFRAEALHREGIHPARPGRALLPDEVARLWATLQAMMRRAVDDGRIVTIDGPDRLVVPESDTRFVYKQERCRDCGAPIEVEEIGGRTSYACPVCQPRAGRAGVDAHR